MKRGHIHPKKWSISQETVSGPKKWEWPYKTVLSNSISRSFYHGKNNSHLISGNRSFNQHPKTPGCFILLII